MSLKEEKILKTISAKEILKTVKDYLPLFYLLLLSVTIPTKAYFFNQYKIDIYSYLDITEYLVYLKRRWYENGCFGADIMAIYVRDTSRYNSSRLEI